MSSKKDRFSSQDKNYMKLAINLARSRKGLTGDNPSVGCLIVKNDTIISIGQTGYNGRPHAEHSAIKNSFEKLKGSKMYVTLEPCVMCAGASYWTQLKKVVYGARDEKRGFQTMAANVLHPKTELVGGIMAEECGEIITDFFASKRQLK